MRLAAMEKLLDGIGLKEVNSMLADLSEELGADEDAGLPEGAELPEANPADEDSPEALDAADSERADAMNRRFEDVVLNERAEGRFL